MQNHFRVLVGSNPLSSRLMRSLAAFAVIAGLLLNFNPVNSQAQSKPTFPSWSAYPAADGSVIDTNLDGVGDLILDGQNSVVVGFNTISPGEIRGVYEFDVQSASKLTQNARVVLYLNQVGTTYSGTDNHLTLYVGAGNGTLALSDFSAGSFFTAFTAIDVGVGNEPWPYDNLIDVTKIVRHLIHKGAHSIVFVIRPNPEAVSTSGALLYSSTEIADIDQFVPAQLVIEK